MQTLDNLHKKALRQIEYCVNAEKYKIEELKLRRERNLVKIIYAYKQSFKVENLFDASTERKLRSTNKVKMKNKFTRKTEVFNSPLYRGV